MPAEVKRREGSFSGMRLKEGRRRWPLLSKKERYFSRISAVRMALIIGSGRPDVGAPSLKLDP
jgi:hypothetical protein